ncbi:MAG: OsmC family protein [Flavobacteriaceae bacterium]|nr:OsmC family protein [Flavobacteriaceae bacterium]
MQKITTHWISNMLFESDNPTGQKVLMDTSPENGGNNKGLGPKAMMLSALAGCTGLDVISILKSMRSEIEALQIEVEASLTEEHPKIYNEVIITYTVKPGQTAHDKVERAIHLSVEKYCGVMEMFRAFAKVQHKVVFV